MQTEAQKRANRKYNQEKCDSIRIRVQKGDKAKIAAFAQAKDCKGVPTMLLAKTVKGKGVSFMENQAGWHGKAPNAEQYEQARQELVAALAEKEGK